MFPLKWNSLSLVIFLSAFAVTTVTVDSVGKYTKEERVALNKFRPMVIDALTKDYQKVDSYLIRWLRIKGLDVNAANQMLHKTLKWRKENNIDNILEEPSILDGTGYPVSINEIDKAGSPVSTYSMAKADFRRILLEGKRNRLFRGHIKVWEQLEMKCQEYSNRTGTEISEAVSIGDMQGFTSIQHLCLPCIALSQDLVTAGEDYYPGLFKLRIIVNGSTIFFYKEPFHLNQNIQREPQKSLDITEPNGQITLTRSFHGISGLFNSEEQKRVQIINFSLYFYLV